VSNNYIFAASIPWCIDVFNKEFSKDTNWTLITNKDDLNIKNISDINPRYIFFPHWNWIVPNSVTDKYECVCFHMANVPYGRGGSPLQNLIARGHASTKLTALRMIQELDAGPVYKKVDLSLNGSAQEIFERMAPKIIDLIEVIILEEPTPKKQTGSVVLFERRTPDQSEILDSMTIEQVYDHIRMLDAENYPKGFLELGNLRFEFSGVKKMENGQLSSNVIISLEGEE
jgi:methionyl-tRNA formyltransferase